MKKVMEVKMSHFVVRNTDIVQLLTTGRTTADVLFKLWQDDHDGSDDQFQLICLLIRAHGLMQAIKPSAMSDSHELPVPELSLGTSYLSRMEFLVPCMLSERKHLNFEGYTFYFDFKGFLPQEVFHCLICLVIKKCREVPDHYPPKYWADECIWYCMKEYDWSVQVLNGEQRLKIIAR